MSADNKVRVVIIEAAGSDAIIMGQALAGVLRALDQADAPAPQVAPVEQPRALLPPRLPAKPKRARQAPLPLKQEGAADNNATRAAILAALEKRPLTSGDVIKATGLEKQTVYAALHELRKAGVVQSRESEDSLYPVQHLVKK